MDLAGSDHYLDLVDLYAARATRARTVLSVHDQLARSSSRSAVPPQSVAKAVSHSRRTGSARAGSGSRPRDSRAGPHCLSILAGSAFADQQYRVREGDTITIVGERFGGDPVAILEASGLDDPEYLYPGQELTIPGIADAGTRHRLGPRHLRGRLRRYHRLHRLEPACQTPPTCSRSTV